METEKGKLKIQEKEGTIIEQTLIYLFLTQICNFIIMNKAVGGIPSAT